MGDIVTFSLPVDVINDDELTLIIVNKSGERISFTSKENPENIPQLKVTFSNDLKNAKDLGANTIDVNNLDIITENINQVILYPNPVSDILYLSENHGLIKIEIYNINSSLQLEVFNATDINAIDVSAFEIGTYIIKGYTQTGKILVTDIVIKK